MKFIIDTTKRFIANDRRLDVNFPFFLDEIDMEIEKNMQHAWSIK